MWIYQYNPWTLQDVQNYRENLYIFADSDETSSDTYIDLVRKEENTIGIPIKKFVSKTSEVSYTDDQYEEIVEEHTMFLNGIYERS